MFGAIAQLGERLNGIQEVGGSIPPGSTRINGLKGFCPSWVLSSLAEEKSADATDRAGKLNMDRSGANC